MKKFKAIDWRLRPPYMSFTEGLLYQVVRQGTDIAPSVKELSMDLLISEMDEAGVEIGVAPYRIGQDNNEMFSMMEKYPNRFIGLAQVNPLDPKEKVLSEIDKFVLQKGAAGVIIEPGQIFMERPLTADDKILYPIYEKCEKDNILLTITHGGLLCAKLENYDAKYIDRVAIDFPNLKIVIAHGGWPYVPQICHVAYQREHVYISPDCYLFGIHPGHQDYVTAANNMLQDKIIFGTGYPGGNGLKQCLENYINSGLKEAVLPKVLYENAAKLLHVKGNDEYARN